MITKVDGTTVMVAMEKFKELIKDLELNEGTQKTVNKVRNFFGEYKDIKAKEERVRADVESMEEWYLRYVYKTEIELRNFQVGQNGAIDKMNEMNEAICDHRDANGLAVKSTIFGGMVDVSAIEINLGEEFIINGVPWNEYSDKDKFVTKLRKDMDGSCVADCNSYSDSRIVRIVMCGLLETPNGEDLHQTIDYVKKLIDKTHGVLVNLEVNRASVKYVVYNCPTEE